MELCWKDRSGRIKGILLLDSNFIKNEIRNWIVKGKGGEGLLGMRHTFFYLLVSFFFFYCGSEGNKGRIKRGYGINLGKSRWRSVTFDAPSFRIYVFCRVRFGFVTSKDWVEVSFAWNYFSCKEQFIWSKEDWQFGEIIFW